MSVGSTTSSQGQMTIHAVELPLFSPSKEGQGSVISREGDGLHLLGCKGHSLHWLPSERPNLNGEYYANLLRQLRKAIKSKRPGKLMKGVLFHEDNAPAHKSVVAVWDCGLNWLITLHILLIWHHLTIICSPTWKTLGWEAVSDQWWGHICSWGLFWGFF